MALAQAGGGKATVRHRSIADSSSTTSRDVIEAERALDQQDYARAKKLALAATIASPQDSRAWFDLGLAERGVEEIPAAIGALRRAVALKSDFFEANLDLGLTLAAARKNQEAITYLRAATKLKPSNPATADEGLFTAWLALSHFARLTRTRPDTASFWARVRDFATRANHSHLSIRWRPPVVGSDRASEAMPAGYSASLASSRALSAARAANGELGSIGRSRGGAAGRGACGRRSRWSRSWRGRGPFSRWGRGGLADVAVGAVPGASGCFA